MGIGLVYLSIDALGKEFANRYLEVAGAAAVASGSNLARVGADCAQVARVSADHTARGVADVARTSLQKPFISPGNFNINSLQHSSPCHYKMQMARHAARR